MSQFIYLPYSRSILNLDHVEAVFPAEDSISAEEIALEVLTNGDPDSVTYEGEDAKVILAAIGKQLGVTGEELAEKIKLEEEEDPLGLNE